MITVRLLGGLGNQLFQYAAGRALAVRHQVPLRLDLRAFQYYTLRYYELSVFDIEVTLICSSYLPPFLLRQKDRLQKKTTFCRSKGHYQEAHFQYDSHFEHLSDGAYLVGDWQSERYFKCIRPLLLQELQVSPPAVGKNTDFLRQILSVNAVSLHVRRGDYVTHPHTHRVHGLCNLDYYQRAIALMTEAVKNPHFFIFSDDLRWVKENLSVPYPMTFVDANDADHGYEDLRLMSHCKHHIIANSSFSWWGAWLNPSSSKIVIAPQKWFNDAKLNTQDLIPAEWVRC